MLDDPGSGRRPHRGPGATVSPATEPPSAGGGASPAGATMPAVGTPSGFSLPNLPTGGAGRDPRSLNDGLFDDDPVDRESADDKRMNTGR